MHLAVKAGGIDGRRLHIDKEMLRDWRQDLAQMMRDQRIAANATSRFVRGQTKKVARRATYRVRRRASCYWLRDQVTSIASELSKTGTIRDPARRQLLATRKAVLDRWDVVASALDAQGETVWRVRCATSRGICRRCELIGSGLQKNSFDT